MEELTTAKLLQMCLYHAGQAEKRCEFYKTKSTASYRVQAAGYAQEWLEFYGSMAEKLELVLQLERIGINAPLQDYERSALIMARADAGHYTIIPYKPEDEHGNRKHE